MTKYPLQSKRKLLHLAFEKKAPYLVSFFGFWRQHIPNLQILLHILSDTEPALSEEGPCYSANSLTSWARQFSRFYGAGGAGGKNRCSVSWQVPLRESQCKPLRFWSRTMPLIAKNYVPFDKYPSLRYWDWWRRDAAWGTK